MLDKNNVEYLNLLYEQLIKSNRQIRECILKADFESISDALNNKNKLIKNIVQFEKPYIDDIKENQYLYSKRIQIEQLEKDNISLLESLKGEIKSKLASINKTKKLYSAYVPGINNAKSTIIIKTED